LSFTRQKYMSGRALASAEAVPPSGVQKLSTD
jgi:hypothetical protein